MSILLSLVFTFSLLIIVHSAIDRIASILGDCGGKKDVGSGYLRLFNESKLSQCNYPKAYRGDLRFSICCRAKGIPAGVAILLCNYSSLLGLYDILFFPPTFGQSKCENRSDNEVEGDFHNTVKRDALPADAMKLAAPYASLLYGAGGNNQDPSGFKEMLHGARKFAASIIDCTMPSRAGRLQQCCRRHNVPRGCKKSCSRHNFQQLKSYIVTEPLFGIWGIHTPPTSRQLFSNNAHPTRRIRVCEGTKLIRSYGTALRCLRGAKCSNFRRDASAGQLEGRQLELASFLQKESVEVMDEEE